MKNCITKYEMAVTCVTEMFGEGLSSTHMRKAIRHFFVEELMPGALIGMKRINGTKYVTIKKKNGKEYTFMSKF